MLQILYAETCIQSLLAMNTGTVLNKGNIFMVADTIKYTTSVRQMTVHECARDHVPVTFCLGWVQCLGSCGLD